MACKALNAVGSGRQADLLKCMEFAVCPTDVNGENPDCSKKPHIASNSWGSASDDVAEIYEDAFNCWHACDIIPVFAAGNGGDACHTINSPAASENVIAVGATDQNDAISSTSSRGPVEETGYLKPDISAPGVDVNSAGHRFDTDYKEMSGTSMACPHVAGYIALMMQHYAACNNNSVMQYDQVVRVMIANAEREKLVRTGETCGTTTDSEFPNNIFGWGRIDAFNICQNCTGIDDGSDENDSYENDDEDDENESNDDDNDDDSTTMDWRPTMILED